MAGVDSRRVTVTASEPYEVRVEVKVARNSGISMASYEAAVEWVNGAEFVIERGEFVATDNMSPRARERRNLPDTPGTYPAWRIRLADTAVLPDGNAPWLGNEDTGWWRSRKEAVAAANGWWLDEVYFAVINELREIAWEKGTA